MKGGVNVPIANVDTVVVLSAIKLQTQLELEIIDSQLSSLPSMGTVVLDVQRLFNGLFVRN
jgi:hypothetical protein